VRSFSSRIFLFVSDLGYRIPLERLSADALSVDTKLTELLSGTPSAFAASVYEKCIPTSASTMVSMKVISDVLQDINTMQRTVGGLMDKILQIDGVGKEWKAADKTCQRLKQVVIYLEDIYCHGLLGTRVLVDTYCRGEMLFQLE
jgi:hypothetical protein